ncbi:MAG: methyltransferase domain-containing protein [Lewinellaceae bacterium]|nr:methyltransferase domain-containing protein [Lewinellaceae bacterium]
MEDRYFNNGWFGKHPAIYDLGGLLIKPLRRRAARILGNKPLNVLDIATGTGEQALATALAGHRVTGIDLDPKMLERAAKKVKPDLALTFMQADGSALPFDDNQFQAVTISFAMHDMPFDIGVEVLREARRVLRPDGFLLIIDANEKGANFGADLYHLIASLYESENYAPFVKRSLGMYFEAAGFGFRQQETFLGAVRFVVADPVAIAHEFLPARKIDLDLPVLAFDF